MTGELNLKNVIKNLLIEETEGDYYKISPDEFKDLMKVSGYHGKGLTKIKMFGGKPLWITGDLDLSNTPTDSLGNVRYIDGKLDIRNTNINDLSGVEVKSYTWDSGTPIERRRLAAIRRKKLEDANERRIDKEWDLDNPDVTDEGLKANALLEYLISNREIEEMDDDEKEELERMKNELETLKQQYDELEDDDEELQNRITDLRIEIEDKESKNFTVYNIIPQIYSYYGLQQFEFVDENGTLEGNDYTVGTEEEMDKAALEYAENYIDEVGIEGFSKNFVENYLDTDAIEDYFRDFYYDDVRENPDVYFDQSEMPTSEEQDRRKEELEEYIEKVEGVIRNLEQKQEQLNDTIEDPDEYTKQWNEIEERIKIIQGHIDDSQQEIDDMVPEGEVTTQMVEDRVNDIVSDKMSDPKAALDEFGISIDEYVDKSSLAEGLIQSDGYGIMGSYDGSYDTERVNGTYYYIMRIS